MEKEFTEHLFYVNRKESFWFHSIRSINYFCYKYWWLVLLLFSTIILLWLLFCLKPFQNQNTTCNGIEVFNGRLNSINNSFNNCCNCNARIGNIPTIPKENCRVHFSGGVMGGEQNEVGITQIYKKDRLSEYVGGGYYSDNTVAFPKAVAHSFDGIAIDNGTRLIIYSGKNYTGSVLLDIQGPAVINNIKWKNDERYSQINTVEYPTNLQRNFPPSVRKWSLTDMHNWSKGSCKIICQDMN